MALAMSNEYDAVMLMKKFSSSVAKSTGQITVKVYLIAAGADYVALILPYQGKLVVEATYLNLPDAGLTGNRYANGILSFHDKAPVDDGLLVYLGCMTE